MARVDQKFLSEIQSSTVLLRLIIGAGSVVIYLLEQEEVSEAAESIPVVCWGRWGGGAENTVKTDCHCQCTENVQCIKLLVALQHSV